MTPVEEHGASTRMRSKRRPARPAGLRMSPVTSVAARFRRARFSAIRATRSAVRSMQVSSIAGSHSSSAPLLPPGAAQASSTRCPGAQSHQARRQLRPRILHRDEPVLEPGQLGYRDRATQGHRRRHPRYLVGFNVLGRQLRDVVGSGGCATGPRARSWADAHCWHRARPGPPAPQARLISLTSQPGCAVRPGTVASTLARRTARSATKRRSTALTRPVERSAPSSRAASTARWAVSSGALREYSIWCAAATSSARTGFGHARGRAAAGTRSPAARRRYQRTVPEGDGAHRGALAHVIRRGQRRIRPTRRGTPPHPPPAPRRPVRAPRAPRGSYPRRRPARFRLWAKSRTLRARRPGRCTCVTASVPWPHWTRR